MTTTSAQYTLTIRVELLHHPGMLGSVTTAIGQAGGTIGAVDLLNVEGDVTIRDISVMAADRDHWDRITDSINSPA